MSNLVYLIGNVGSDPVERETPKGKVIGFSIAQPNGFGMDAPPPTWYDVAVWNDSMRDQIKREIHKGTAVAVIGPLKEKQGNNKTFRSVNALRVALTHAILPTRVEMWPENSKPKPVTPELKLGDPRGEKPDDDDDLGF